MPSKQQILQRLTVLEAELNGICTAKGASFRFGEGERQYVLTLGQASQQDLDGWIESTRQNFINDLEYDLRPRRRGDRLH